MESNTNWTHVFTGTDFQISLLRSQLEQAEVFVMVKKATLEVVYGGNSTTSLARLYVPNEQLDIATPIVKSFDEKEKTE